MIKLRNLLKEAAADGHIKIDPGPKRWYKPYGDKYTEYEKATNKSLKEYGGAEFSEITALMNRVIIAIDKFEDQLKEPRHKSAYRNARKKFMDVVSKTAFEHEGLHEDNKKEIRFDLVMSDEAYDELFDLIARYVEDPDDVEKELDRYDAAGFDGMSNLVTANLDRDKDYITWKKKYGIKESVNEALPKFKTPYEAYSWIMNKRGEAMDIETEMLNISGEIHDKYKDMEQEAEPAGGPIQARYAKEIEALELQHKNLRAQFAKVMAEIDEYDQNY